MPTTVKSRRKEPYISTKCPFCKIELEYLKPSTSDFEIECCSCSRLFPLPSSSSTTGKPSGTGTGGGRRIGTDAKPLDMTYYTILGVGPLATDAEIKSSYRRLALKKHPDKLIGLKGQAKLDAEEEFKGIAIAYAVLSDPKERKRYNEFGPAKNQSEEGFVDPEAVFSQLFGGERFVDIIGTVSLGQEMKSAMQKESDDNQTPASEISHTEHKDGQPVQSSSNKKKELTPEEKAAKQAENAERARIKEERIQKLLENLQRKIAIFTEQARNGGQDPEVRQSVKAIWAIEAEDLKTESYGVELLHAVGAVYQSKAKQYTLSNSSPFGVGGWFHGVKSTAGIFSETVSTLRSAYELSDIFKELSAAEEKGLSDEKKKELEEKAAQKGMQALFKGAKLEIDMVIREVVDRLIYDSQASKDTISKRVAALEILGGVYLNVKKEDHDPLADYVQINSGNSKRPNAK